MKMRKLVSLLLVGCMTLGLVACGDTSVKESEESKSSVPTSSSEVSGSVEEEVVKNPYEGTSIEVWGVLPEEVTAEVMSASWWNLTVAAMDEWAALNGVTMEWKGAWNQNAFMAAVAGGEKPDMIFSYALFPNTVNYGFSQPLSDEAYEKLAAVCGEQFLDALVSKGECYGVNLPANGTYVTYYNKTMFDNYGVKTPKEYFMEGNWTWETFEQCMTEVTKDLDGDGVNDTYGMASNWFDRLAGVAAAEGSDGKLTSNMDTEKFRDYAEIFYKGVNETGSIVMGTANIKSQLENPRPAMMFLDNRMWDISKYFQTLGNGDVIEFVPIPAHSSDETVQMELLSYCLLIPKASDNVDAAVDMMSYVLQCHMKFREDASLGLFTSEFEGLQGTTAVSAAWLADHKVQMESRKAYLEDPAYDEEYLKAMVEYQNNAEFYIQRYWAGVDIPGRGEGDFEALGTMPPASSMAEMIPIFQGQLDSYNSMYVY